MQQHWAWWNNGNKLPFSPLTKCHRSVWYHESIPAEKQPCASDSVTVKIRNKWGCFLLLSDVYEGKINLWSWIIPIWIRVFYSISTVNWLLGRPLKSVWLLKELYNIFFVNFDPFTQTFQNWDSFVYNTYYFCLSSGDQTLGYQKKLKKNHRNVPVAVVMLFVVLLLKVYRKYPPAYYQEKGKKA